MEWWISLIVLGYLMLGAVINGLMHRYDPQFFDRSATQVAIVVLWWIIVLPIYWFWIFCDRCIVWFDKKEK